jgi:hypothetical protein
VNSAQALPSAVPTLVPAKAGNGPAVDHGLRPAAGPSGTSGVAASQGEGETATPDPGCAGTRHGDENAYVNHGCTCPPARADHNRRRRQRGYRLHWQGSVRVDATGTRRRLQALATAGWSAQVIADLLGVGPKTHICRIRAGARARVLRSTAQRVQALYDELWDRPGPSLYARNYAAKRAWALPLAWDDDTIDDPAAAPNLAGDGLDIEGLPEADKLDVWRGQGRAGQEAIVAYGHARGWSLNETGVALGYPDGSDAGRRQAERIRRRLDLAGRATGTAA